MRDAALRERVVLRFEHPVWVAEDAVTGEQAVGQSMKSAWANLRETDTMAIDEKFAAFSPF